MPAELQVLNGQLQWKRVKMTGPRCLIGRRDDCHLVLKDAWVSREHTLIIETAPGQYKVQDLDSENGSYVNGDRITESPLKHQDILRVGRTEMRFVAPTDASSASAHRDDESEVPSQLSGGATPLDRTMSTRTPLPAAGPLMESGGAGDVTVFDQRARASETPRTDLRERVRRLEKLLLEKEEENSRLASENTVFKRAMAQGGFLDRKTGFFDINRLRTPAPVAVVPQDLRRFVANPLARIAYPSASEGTENRPSGARGERDGALGVHRLALVGVGACGARLAEAFCRLGHLHSVALGTDAEILDQLGMDLSRRVHLDASGADDGGEDEATLVGEAQLRLQSAFKSVLGAERTLSLVAVGLGGRLGTRSVTRILSFLDDYEGLARSAGTPSQKGLLLAVPSRRELADPALRARAQRDAETARKLMQADKLRPIILIDQERLEGLIPGDEDEARDDRIDTVAGAIDLLNRLPMLDPLAGDLDARRLEETLKERGVSTLGLAATPLDDEESLARAVRHALGDGLLFREIPASRARHAIVLAVIGSEVPVGDATVVARLESSVALAGEVLPQAKVAAGIYQDDGPGVRILTLVGGLPIPETLVG